MIEIHCFATLRDSFKPEDEETERYLPELKKIIENLDNYYGIELKAKNGERYIEFSHFTNHLGEDFHELLGFFESIGKIAKGSYGLFYFYDDEDKSEFNSFQVWRLAKGEIRKFEDNLLSPYVPTVEDIDSELTTADKQLLDKLKKYTRYANGDLSCKCELIVQDHVISNFDFSKYDLGGSTFVGSQFRKCNFGGVYLSHSFFGGNTFIDCKLKNNILRKADWNRNRFYETTVLNLDAFRVDLFESFFKNTNFRNGSFFRCMFSGSEFSNVTFSDCTFEDTDFDSCKCSGLVFRNCTLKNTTFAGSIAGIRFIDCKDE